MEIKKEVAYTGSLAQSEVLSECQSELSLPDYNGDVRKILYTNAELRPSGSFASTDSVELSGIVVFEVVYLNADGEMESTSFTGDYDMTVKCPEGFTDCIAEPRLAGYTVRLVGPRRISARASLCSGVRVSVPEVAEIRGGALEMQDKLEGRTVRVKIRNTVASQPLEREYAEPVTALEGAIADEVTVIHTAAEARADSAERAEGGVEVKGELWLRAVLKNGEEPAYSVEKIIPIAELVPWDRAGEGMLFSPSFTVTSLTAAVNPNPDGCAVVMNAILEIAARAEYNEEVELVADGYLRSHKTAATYRDLAHTSVVDVRSVREAHSCSVGRAEAMAENIREVVFMSSSVKGEVARITEGAVEVKGEIRYSGIGSEVGDDGAASYFPIKYSEEFCKNVNIGSHNTDNLRAEVKVVPTRATARVDAEKLHFSSELDLKVTLLSEKSERVLASLEAEGEELVSSPSKITVYYPTPGESLFSVAKRYRTTVEKLARDNSLTESVFASAAEMPSGVKRLIIT